MPSTPFFFSCHFCNFKTKIQTDLNVHLLFIHFFENPECSTDTASVAENYLYSKNHFKQCMMCNNSTMGLVESEKFTSFELQNPRSMVNYFCWNHYDVFTKGKEDAINTDKSNKEYGIKSHNLQRYYQTKKYCDAVWQFIQSVPSHKVRMYEKTLYRIHTKPKQKEKDTNIIGKTDTFINVQNRWLQRKDRKEVPRID